MVHIRRRPILKRIKVLRLPTHRIQPDHDHIGHHPQHAPHSNRPPSPLQAVLRRLRRGRTLPGFRALAQDYQPLPAPARDLPLPYAVLDRLHLGDVCGARAVARVRDEQRHVVGVGDRDAGGLVGVLLQCECTQGAAELPGSCGAEG